MKKNSKYETKMPEGLRRYYIKAAGLWGWVVDNMSEEGREELSGILMGSEPVYSKEDLEEARREVIDKIYNFVDKESGKSGRKEILEFLSKLKQ